MWTVLICTWRREGSFSFLLQLGCKSYIVDDVSSGGNSHGCGGATSLCPTGSQSIGKRKDKKRIVVVPPSLSLALVLVNIYIFLLDCTSCVKSAMFVCIVHWT